MTRNSVLSEEAARKRQEIGLSARRETARAAVLRPPTSGDTTNNAPVRGFGGWWLVFFTSLLGLATFLLIAARFVQSPTDLPNVNADVVSLTDGKLDLQGVQSTVQEIQKRSLRPVTLTIAPRLFDDFTANQSILSEGMGASRRQRVVPEEGVYRMQVERGNAAWSLLGNASLRRFRLETSARIVIYLPHSHAGVVMRFVDPNHFYLFTVDGKGNFEVLRANGAGNWQLLLPKTPSNAINAAGVGNVLEVEDQGDLIRFAVNGTRLFEHHVAEAEIAVTGDAGLWTSAPDNDPAVVDFERIRVEPIQP